MLHWLGSNLRTFLWALALAAAVWVSAVTSSDPVEVRQLPAPIPIEIVGQDAGLVITGEYARQVEVTLRAPKSVWDQIAAQENSVRASIDLSGRGAGSHKLEVQIQVAFRPVQIAAASPLFVELTLEQLRSRVMPVDLTLSGEPAVGYQAGEGALDPQEVVISGAASLVARVERARVLVNLQGARESIDQSLPVELLDEDGLPVAGLSVSPEKVGVTLPVSQQGGYRDVAVKVVVRGQVASGYSLTSISVFPPLVTVYASDPQRVSALPGVVETQPLDLQNADQDIILRLGLNLPADISVVGDQTVQVHVGVAPIQSTLTLSNKPIEIVGLAEDLSALISPQTVDVILAGPVPLLQAFTSQDVRVIVDVTGLSAGTYQLAPMAESLITEITIRSILPETIEVVLTGATPTPTPTP